MNKVSLLHFGVIEMCLKIKLVLLLASETCKEVTNMLCLMCGMVTCCVYLVWLCCIPVKQVAEMFAHRTAGRTVQLKKMVANCQHKLHKMHFASNQTLETCLTGRGYKFGTLLLHIWNIQRSYVQGKD